MLFRSKEQKNKKFQSLHYSIDQGLLFLGEGAKFYASETDGGGLDRLEKGFGATVAGIHAKDDLLIIGFETNKVVLSYDQGANFEESINTNLFSTKARVGFIHNQDRILSFGVNSSYQVIPAIYDASTKSFVQLKDSSKAKVVISSGSDGIYPVQVDFTDGKTGYVSVHRPDGGDYFFKTTDGGTSWSSKESSSSTFIPAFQILKDGDFWLGFGDSLKRYKSDNLDSSFTIPDGSHIRGIHFFTSELGILITTTAAWITYDGGSSLLRQRNLADPPSALAALNGDKVVFSGSNLNLQILESQMGHQPLTSLNASIFSTSNPLRSVHFAFQALKSEDLVDGALKGEHIENRSLSADKIAALTIVSDDIETGSLDRYLFATQSITTIKLSANEDGIHGDSLRADILDSNHIIDGTITGAELADSILNSQAITDGSLTTELIKDDSFFGSVLADYQITTAHLRDHSFTDSEFGEGIFSDENFRTSTLSTSILSTTSFDLENEKIVLRTLTDSSLSSEQISSFHIEDSSLFGFLIKASTITSEIGRAHV